MLPHSDLEACDNIYSTTGQEKIVQKRTGIDLEIVVPIGFLATADLRQFQHKSRLKPTNMNRAPTNSRSQAIVTWHNTYRDQSTGLRFKVCQSSYRLGEYSGHTAAHLGSSPEKTLRNSCALGREEDLLRYGILQIS